MTSRGPLHAAPAPVEPSAGMVPVADFRFLAREQREAFQDGITGLNQTVVIQGAQLGAAGGLYLQAMQQLAQANNDLQAARLELVQEKGKNFDRDALDSRIKLTQRKLDHDHDRDMQMLAICKSIGIPAAKGLLLLAAGHKVAALGIIQGLGVEGAGPMGLGGLGAAPTPAPAGAAPGAAAPAPASTEPLNAAKGDRFREALRALLDHTSGEALDAMRREGGAHFIKALSDATINVIAKELGQARLAEFLESLY